MKNLNILEIATNYSLSIKKEEEIFSKIPHLQTGKTPSENFSINLIHNFDNLKVKNKIKKLLISYIAGLDVTNSLIIKSYELWELIRSNNKIVMIFNTKIFAEYFMTNQFIVHSIRCFVERMIGLVYYLKKSEQSKITVSSIGDYIKKKDKTFNQFDTCIDFFKLIDEIDNAYKHTVFNDLFSWFDKNENTIIVSYAYRNNNINNPKIIRKRLSEIINSFNYFYKTLFEIVKSI